MLLAYEGFFSREALAQFGFRWLHILVAIVWIGLLYFFNVVQVPAYAMFEDAPHADVGGRARLIAIDKVTRKALNWFRWSALATFLTGIFIVGLTKQYFGAAGDGSSGMKIGGNVGILTGMLLGTIMMLNVWGVIWRCQKTVLANAANVLAGGQPDPEAAAAGRRALMASRQNTIFSVTLLFFMVFRAHHPYTGVVLSSGKLAAYWIIALVIIAVLEINALGLLPWKTKPNAGLNVLYDGPGIRNFVVASFGLFVIFLILTEVLFKP